MKTICFQVLFSSRYLKNAWDSLATLTSDSLRLPLITLKETKKLFSTTRISSSLTHPTSAVFGSPRNRDSQRKRDSDNGIHRRRECANRCIK